MRPGSPGAALSPLTGRVEYALPVNNPGKELFSKTTGPSAVSSAADDPPGPARFRAAKLPPKLML